MRVTQRTDGDGNRAAHQPAVAPDAGGGGRPDMAPRATGKARDSGTGMAAPAPGAQPAMPGDRGPAPRARAKAAQAPGAQRVRRLSSLGVLPMIAGLFLASALLRIGDGVSGALAGAGPVDGAAAPAGIAAPVAPPDDAAALAEALATLRAREARLTAREGTLADRLQALDLAERRLALRLADLAEAEERLAALVATADRASERDIDHLVAAYLSMKPQDAAALFAEMDPVFAAGFLARMPPEGAGAILAGLEPRSAYALSAILAGRNARAPVD